LARRSLSQGGSTLRVEMLRRDRSRLSVALRVARSDTPSTGFVALVHGLADHSELERRLAEAQGAVGAVMDAMQDAALVVKNGRIHSANSQLETLLDLPRRELLGRPFAELVASEDLLAALERAEKALRGGAPQEVSAMLVPGNRASG